MHRKFRTVMLIIAMAIICVAAPSSLFQEERLQMYRPRHTRRYLSYRQLLRDEPV